MGSLRQQQGPVVTIPSLPRPSQENLQKLKAQRQAQGPRPKCPQEKPSPPRPQKVQGRPSQEKLPQYPQYPPYGGQYQQGPYPPPYQQGAYPPPGQYQQGAYPQYGGYQPQAGYPPQYAGQYGGPQYGQAYGQAPPPSGPPPQFGAPDAESVSVHGPNPFDDKVVRMAFIRKVYAILSLQLLVTTAVIAIFAFSPQAHDFARKNPGVFLAAGLMGFACVLPLSCCVSVARSFPTNAILLSIFTMCEAVLLGGMCAYYKAEEVMMAAGVTTAIFLGLTLFASQTKVDFTPLNGIMFIILIVFIIFGVIAAIFPSRTMRLIYAAGGTIIFSVYIVIDTQMILGGERAYQLTPEDYIVGALMLYIDVINLFQNLLQLISALNNDE